MNTKVPTMQELLSAGVHFGHKVSRGHPRMKPFVFGARDGVHIIDLALSEEKLKEAAEAAFNYGSQNKSLLIVGTKKQAREIVDKLAHEANLFYLNSRWIGGVFTNFTEVRKNIEKLVGLRDEQAKGTLSRYTKREQLILGRKIKKFETDMGGISTMTKLPDVVFVIDTVSDKTAIKEANIMGIPVIGFSDTNANPDLLEYAIPANDDGIKSISLIAETIISAYQEGMKKAGVEKEESDKKEAKKAEDEAKEKETNVTKETKVTKEDESADGLNEIEKEEAAAIEEDIEKVIVDESSRKVE